MVTVRLMKVRNEGEKKGKLTGLVTSCVRNCLLKHVIERDREGRREVTKGGCRRHKQLLCDCKENWKLKEEALNRTPWGSGSGIAYGPVARRTAE